MTRFLTSTVAFALTVFHGLTAVTALTSFNTGNRSPLWRFIEGRYTKTASRIDYTIYFHLTIKKFGQYTLTYKRMGLLPGKGTIKGNIGLNSDTLYFHPYTYKSEKKCDCLTEKNIIWCKTDTLIYKDNALWRYNRSTKEIYKQYTKK